jgi:hypothetical protein
VTKIRGVLCAAAVGIATMCLIPVAANAESPYWRGFCSSEHVAHAKCEGPKLFPLIANAKSTNGGWSWVWVWNEKYGGDSNQCESGNCKAEARVGGGGEGAHGQEQMANISGSTYNYHNEWYGYNF